MNRKKVAVIGGGASGMMAAIYASNGGADVTVFEKNKKIGRKIYITGKGRCNVTNNCNIETVIANTPTNGRFLYSALNVFSPADTIEFFESHGLPLKTERGNRVFPVSDRAADVVDTLLRTAKKSGCNIVNKTVTDIITDNGAVCGVSVLGERHLFDSVIIATGGKSYPLTGSTGDGYKFAKKLGHTVIEPKASLVPIETVESIDPCMDRLLLKNISFSVTDTYNDGKEIYTDFGEMQFMRYGLSGAVVLSASSHIGKITEGRYKLTVDLKPALSERQLDARLLREFSANNKKSCEYIFRFLVPNQMTGMLLSMSKVPPDKCCSEITKAERNAIVHILKNLTFTAKKFRPIEEAIVTSGGVSVKEINPKTMESKLVKGLYFAGEVIDVDCYTGGFNLQSAFSTGVLAGCGARTVDSRCGARTVDSRCRSLRSLLL